MMKPSLALCLVAWIGCATDPSPGNVGDDDDGGGGGSTDAGVPDGGGGSGSGSGTGEMPPFTSGVSTLSGAADPGYVDGPRGPARFANPVNVALAADGKVFVADFDNGKIRAVTPDGTTSTVIAAQGFRRPFGLAFAPDGTLYVSTDDDPQGLHGPMTGTIWRIDIAGKTATPIAARIGRPRGLAVLPTGELVATDYVHHVVELVYPLTGAVVPLAGAWDVSGLADGPGPDARFTNPYGVVVVGGEIIVADLGNHRLRKIGPDGAVSTFAGSTMGFADGALATAQLNRPQGLAATAAGDLYVTDTGNYRVRRISGGVVSTIAGTGTAGFADSDDRLAAQLYGLEGLCVAADGSLVIVADGSRGDSVPYNRVRSIKMP